MRIVVIAFMAVSFAMTLLAQTDAGEAPYNEGVSLVKDKKYQEAIDRWRQIRQDSSLYEKAQSSIERAQKMLEDDRQKRLQEERERKKIPPGMQENVIKPIAFWSGVAVGAAGVTLNVLGFLDGLSVQNTRAAYAALGATNSGPEFDALWKAHSDLVNQANIKNIAAYACYGIAAGLVTWWLVSPEFVPEVKVSVLPGVPGRELVFAFSYRF